MSEPAVPRELRDRPRDRHGRIIGWTVAIGDDGEPMHGTNVALRCAEAIERRRCGLCGNPLAGRVAFVGNGECVLNRSFLEPPMHEACARYSLAVCPYLLAAEGFTASRERPGVAVLADRSRPARMALYVTRDFRPLYGDHPPMSLAGAPIRLEWF